MDVGLYFDMRNPAPWRRPWTTVYGETLEQIEEAERLGVDAVWFTEHHFFDDGYLTQPTIMAAAAAVRTRSLRIGTAVVIAPFRNALQLAEESALIDVLSGGRFELGLGAGYRRPEFVAFGADVSERFDATDGLVRDVRGWFEDPRFCPAPVQPRLPIWLGYKGARGARRAGLLGENLLATDASVFEHYREGLIDGGHRAEDAVLGGVVGLVLARDPERTNERLRPHILHQVNSIRRYGAEETGGDPQLVGPNDLRRPEPALGRGAPVWAVTPDDAVEEIQSATSGLPVRHVFFWADIAGMPSDIRTEHVELLATVVKPQLSAITTMRD